MSVHYKFKSALKYDTITFDGLHISVKDLKRDILQQKQIGKTGDFDLQITNAQTNEGRRKFLVLVYIACRFSACQVLILTRIYTIFLDKVLGLG